MPSRRTSISAISGRSRRAAARASSPPVDEGLRAPVATAQESFSELTLADVRIDDEDRHSGRGEPLDSVHTLPRKRRYVRMTLTGQSGPIQGVQAD